MPAYKIYAEKSVIIPIYILKKMEKSDIIIIKLKREEVLNMSVIKIDKNNFDQIKNSDKRILLDFYADWCGPCRMVSPIVDEIAEENPQYIVGKINVDDDPELAIEFSVSTIPNLVVLEGGKVINQVAGARPKPQILKMLEE